MILEMIIVILSIVVGVYILNKFRDDDTDVDYLG
jgi:hypothetical protein